MTIDVKYNKERDTVCVTAHLSRELIMDLKSICGLDPFEELSNLLACEISEKLKTSNQLFVKRVMSAAQAEALGITDDCQDPLIADLRKKYPAPTYNEANTGGVNWSGVGVITSTSITQGGAGYTVSPAVSVTETDINYVAPTEGVASSPATVFRVTGRKLVSVETNGVGIWEDRSVYCDTREQADAYVIRENLQKAKVDEVNALTGY